MGTTVGAYLPPGTLREAVEESHLQGASKSQVVRFALLRLVMPAREARSTVLGVDLTETGGRVDAFVPPHELELVRNAHPGMPVSTLIRYALAIAAGDTPEKARKFAAVKRGRPVGSHGQAKP